MKASKGVRRLAVLLGSIGSTAWLIFVMFASNFFTRGGDDPRDWIFLAVSTGICFLIPFLLVHGTAWVIRGFREDNGDRPTGQVISTEKENGRNEIRMSKEGYGYNELEIMKQQFGGLLRNAALWVVLCLILGIVVILATKFM
jgi:hypothetical protein